MPTPAAGIIAPNGVHIVESAFLAACGGRRPLQRLLKHLSITEKPQPSRPQYLARRKLPAYRITRPPGGRPPYVTVPAAVAEKLETAGLLRLHPAAALAAAPHNRAPADEAPADPHWPAFRHLEWPEPTLPLYPYQAAIIAHFTRPGGPLSPARRAAGTARALLHLGTGLGKTIIALALAAACNGPALFVCERESQREQLLNWAAELYPELRSAPYNNATVEHKRPSARTHDIVAVIINTARDKPLGSFPTAAAPDAAAYPANFYAGYACVLFDEADAYCTARSYAPFWAGAPAVVALTATINERSDGFDAILQHFFGAPIAPDAIPGCDVAALAFRGRARVVKYRGHPQHVETAVTAAGTASAMGTIQNLYCDPHRVQAVVHEVLALLRADLGVGAHSETGVVYRRRYNPFIFTECRDRLDVLQAAIRSAASAAPGGLLGAPDELVYAPELAPDGAEAAADGAEAAADGAEPLDPALVRERTGILRGGVVGGEAAAARNSRVILLTYGYGRRGLSVDEMNAIVFDSCRRRGMTQILGRIERRGSDANIERVVVDIVDVRTSLKSQHPDRRRAYKDKNYAIETVDADWSDYDVPEDQVAPAAESE